jgi:DNA-binding NarL/FixJ family response regulator
VSSVNKNEPVRVGVLTDEPLRMEGLASIFEGQPSNGNAPLTPVFGDYEQLLSDSWLSYLVVDLNANSNEVETVEAIRRQRPDMRLIVIGPDRDDKLIMSLILSGVRAFLEQKANSRIIRQAVDVVISGSIWAPRRVLSQLIDRLITTPDASLTSAPPSLTDREHQVLELILTACPNREIARQLGIEESTVQAHVGRLMRKTGAESRIDLLMSASNPALLEAAGIKERRHVERRNIERRRSESR